MQVFLPNSLPPHGGAEDSLILSVVECVKHSHTLDVVGKAEVPMVEEYRSERAVPNSHHAPELGHLSGQRHRPALFCGQWMIGHDLVFPIFPLTDDKQGLV